MKRIFSFATVLNLFLIYFIVTLDYMSKKWVVQNIPFSQSKYIFFVLNILNIRNYGSAFGFFSKKHIYQGWFIFFTILIILVLVFQFFYLFFRTNKYQYLPYLFIIGGAIGNLIDRIKYGGVIDFIDVHFLDWHSSTFNVADISIFIGSSFLLK